MSKGIYKYTDLEINEIVYVGKDSHIDRNDRHKAHMRPSRYDDQPFNRILQNNPDRDKRKYIQSASLEKLKKKVKNKGLEWRKL